jgi:hypothetical protein
MEYHLRQKEEKHTALLAVGKEGEFNIDKDRMRVRVPDNDGKLKEHEFLVVSEAPRTDTNAPAYPPQ